MGNQNVVVIDDVLIRNFRSIDELRVSLHALTTLIGANSTGKSSVIKALEWFFEATELSLADVRDQDPGRTVSVRVTFSQFTDADRAAFPGYTTGEKMILLKTRTADGVTKLTGRGLVYPPFRDVRAHQGAVDLRRAYNSLRAAEPALDLPAVTSKDQALRAMEDWELGHPERCEEDDRDATHLLGAVGGGVLRQRFKFVLVPALRDAAEEAREARGSTLTRLLSAIAEQRAGADERVAALELEVRQRYEEVVVDAHAATLEDLSRSMTEQIRAFVSRGEVRLEAVPGTLSLPEPRVVVQAGEARSLTDISRQGHGFQRAFVITALRYLSEAAVEGEDAPTIFLAVEEPELYQHPVRARHFAAVLEALSERERGRVQVVYATHSPYFVNANLFESIRLFRRDLTDDGRLLPPRVASATANDVGRRLEGVVDRGHIGRRLTRTIDSNPEFSEAFFANAVLLAEGPHDLAVLRGVAAMNGPSLEEEGIVAVHASKTGIPVALAILNLLSIPTYVIFDGDVDCAEARRDEQARLNHAILSVRGIDPPPDFPPTQAADTWAVFQDNLEEYLRASINDFDRKCETAAVGAEWRVKSGETYTEVIRAEAAAPAMLVEVTRRVRQLAAPPPAA